MSPKGAKNKPKEEVIVSNPGFKTDGETISLGKDPVLREEFEDDTRLKDLIKAQDEKIDRLSDIVLSLAESIKSQEIKRVLYACKFYRMDLCSFFLFSVGWRPHQRLYSRTIQKPKRAAK